MKLDRTSYFRVLRIANGAEFKDARARVVVSPDAFASGELIYPYADAKRAR